MGENRRRKEKSGNVGIEKTGNRNVDGGQRIGNEIPEDEAGSGQNEGGGGAEEGSGESENGGSRHAGTGRHTRGEGRGGGGGRATAATAAAAGDRGYRGGGGCGDESRL